jgi:6-phosphogluconolactonase
MAEIERLPDPDRLAERACAVCLERMEAVLSASDRFSLVLSGGSTPGRLYARLAEARPDWRRVHLFWGDERCVPPDHPESNYRLVAETLLRRIQIPPGNVHRIPGEQGAGRAAREYRRELRRFFAGQRPRLDLVLLGLGADGHTASLFPLSPALGEARRAAVAVEHRVPPPPLVDRVSLTLPVLNAGVQLLFLVAGADKADVLARVLEGPFQPERLPAQAIRPQEGRLVWLVDAAAAARLSAPPPASAG